MTPLAVRIVRSPGGITDDVRLIVENRGGLFQYDAVAGQLRGGLAEPLIALRSVGRPQIDDEHPAIARLQRSVDDCFVVRQVVSGQPGDQINRKIGMAEWRAELSE